MEPVQQQQQPFVNKNLLLNYFQTEKQMRRIQRKVGSSTRGPKTAMDKTHDFVWSMYFLKIVIVPKLVVANV